jgi:valyl-tRNA synthetase
MKMKSLAEPAIRAVQKEDIKIISASEGLLPLDGECERLVPPRQVWYGHQCPAYFVRVDEAIDRTDSSRWVAGRTEDEARPKAEAKFPGKQFALERDPDILDTCFSAGPNHSAHLVAKRYARHAEVVPYFVLLVGISSSFGSLA